MRARDTDFKITSNTYVELDPRGNVRGLLHIQEPYRIKKEMHLASLSELDLAQQYIRGTSSIYKIEKDQLIKINEPIANDNVITNDKILLRLYSSQSIHDSKIISYVQTYFGLPIWQSGITITIQESPLGVTSSTTTLHQDININKPSEQSRFLPELINFHLLQRLLNFEENRSKLDSIQRIHSTRLLIYKYDSNKRQKVGEDLNKTFIEGDNKTKSSLILNLPDISTSAISDDNYYVVTEILFDAIVRGYGKVNWRTFVEVETGSILYLEPLVASLCFGHVYPEDPVTISGDASITPNPHQKY